jgi:hypothetical protein
MLVSTAVFAVDKDIHKLEDAYIEKSRKLTESYIAALKQLEVRVTKKGDLDSAITVRNKIAEIEALLNGLPKPKPKEIPLVDARKVVGKWQNQQVPNKIFTIKADNTVTVSNAPGRVFKWKVSGNSITFDWGNTSDTYKIKGNMFAEGKSSKGHIPVNYKRIIK